MGTVTLRKFEEKDVPNKVKWINDDRNNQFLHYDIPLEAEKTRRWYLKNQTLTDRYDAVIEYDDTPVGVIGLLEIHDGRAEYYVTLGEPEYKGHGIAKKATELLLEFAFRELALNEVYLYTEVENMSAQRLFERCGFQKRNIEYASAINRGKAVDRYYYVITAEAFMRTMNIRNLGGGTAP